MSAITTQHIREFLGYLRDTTHRFNSNCPRAKKPINSTTIQDVNDCEWYTEVVILNGESHLFLLGGK